MPDKQKKQIWYCSACCKAGSVVLTEHAGVVEALGTIRSDHRKNSLDCDNPTGIQALNLDDILGKVLPHWAAKEIVRILETP